MNINSIPEDIEIDNPKKPLLQSFSPEWASTLIIQSELEKISFAQKMREDHQERLLYWEKKERESLDKINLIMIRNLYGEGGSNDHN